MSAITEPVFLNRTGVLMNETLNRIIEPLQEIAEYQRRQAESAVHYGVRIDKNDSNPDTRMTYMYDCTGFVPAKMDYTKGKFDYGSWDDAFFIRNNYPAMVTFDGIEDYKLDPSDQTKKEDGVTASDVSNMAYEGSAMSVFDCKIWMYLHQDENYEYIEVSNVKLNDNFYDYGYVRPDGTHADKLYFPMFFGSKDSNDRIRSIADQWPWYLTGGTQNEINAASAAGSHWGILDLAHRIVINSLLTLIGLSDNTQTTFGNGQISGYVDDAEQHYGHLQTGTLKDKGQFFGYNDSVHDVKVFFIENWWGNTWSRCLGLINANGTYKYKLAPPYNLTGAGYASIPNVTPPASGWQVNTMMGHFGRLPISTGEGGSSSTYTCDYYYGNNAIVAIALWGGACVDGANCGSSCLNLIDTAGNSNWNIGFLPVLYQP